MKMELLKLIRDYTIAVGTNGFYLTAKMAVFGCVGAVGTKVPFLSHLNPLL